jgi:hypothetical protein
MDHPKRFSGVSLPIAVALLATWAAFCFRIVRHYHRLAAPLAVSAQAGAKPDPGFGFYLLRAQSLLDPALVADADVRRSLPVAPDSCRTLWTESVMLDLTRFAAHAEEPPTDGEIAITLSDPEGARAAVASILQRDPCVLGPATPVVASLWQATADTQRACRAAGELPRCLDALWRMRLAATRYLSRGIPLGQISDVGLLTARLFDAALTVPSASPGEVAAIAERIAELDPHHVGALRAATQFRFLEAIRRPADSGVASRLAATLTAARALERAQDDRSELVTEVRLDLARRHHDWNEVRRLAERARLRFPGSGLGDYHLAWLAYLLGRPAGAEAYLRHALSAAARPRLFARLRTSWDRLRAGSFSQPFSEDLGTFGYRLQWNGRSPASDSENGRNAIAVTDFASESGPPR